MPGRRGVLVETGMFTLPTAAAPVVLTAVVPGVGVAA